MDKIYQSDSYTILKDKIIQGEFEAVASSSTSISSNYESPVNQELSPAVSFKFSINGKDNEMISGKNHLVNVISDNGMFESPLIRFGEISEEQQPVPPGVFLKPGSHFKVRLDMRHVLAQFKQTGYYTAFDGTKIYEADFKGVFIAGNVSPLIWDFDNLAVHKELQLLDEDGDGIYEITLEMNKPQEKKITASYWELSKDISAFPQYSSTFPLMDALYNLSLEEMINAVEPDSTFRTGKEWAGVWTRDISYSIILSMATLQPEVAENSLLKKVKNERVIQDTGSGGSWPVSSDRMIWAVAAWEVYKVTGDQDWLARSYRIIRNSVEDDLKNVYDRETGLVRGESSFLDWRDQTYPKWMEPADIYSSENLGTNAVHFQTNKVLARMAALLKDNEAVEKYDSIAEKIKAGINKYLWVPERGYYGQYRYGRQFPILSPRAEALGEALTVLFDIADEERQRLVLSKTPVTDFGIPCIYPQIPNIPPYHNNGIWPFVQSYWSLAAAKTGNSEALIQSMAAIFRPAALFLTNKENFVSTTGDFAGTQINSSNMLWSLSGNLSMIYKILFGMETREDAMVFRPFVPKELQGKRQLNNYRYRNAILNISLDGFGNQISSIKMDGRELPAATVPSNLSGTHNIEIILSGNITKKDGVAHVPNLFSPAAPLVSVASERLSWEAVDSATHYLVIRNGRVLRKITDLNFAATESGEYQVIALDAAGVSSFASEPVQVYPSAKINLIDLSLVAAQSDLPYQGYTGKGFIEISHTNNRMLRLILEVPESGSYALDIRYANGNGPTNTENKCAIRNLNLDGQFAGTFVFPQRGRDEWSNWGFSNTLVVTLNKGSHEFMLSFEDWNENMNGEVNQAMLDQLRVIRIN